MSRLIRQLINALKVSCETGRAPNIPEAGRDLWGIFVTLSRSRTYHMAGPNPVSFSEISEYARLQRWPLQPHHVDVITALDAAWLEYAFRSEAGKCSKGVKALPRHSGQAVNPSVFDAVFG